MKKRFFLFLVFLIVLSFTLTACNSESNEGYNSSDSEGVAEDSSSYIIINQSNRKIIYTFDINMDTDDFDKTLDDIHSLVSENEEAGNWIESSDTHQSGDYKYANLKIRVKTDNINEFIDGLSSSGNITSQSHNTRDITYTYAQAESRISALQDEKQYIEDMLDEMSVSNRLTYIGRISDINSELMLLQQELTKYDSDVEYSTVNVSIQEEGSPSKTSFGQKLKNAFWGSINFVSDAFQWILVALIYILPFAIVGGGIAFGVIGIKKKVKAKRQSKDDKDNK